MTTHALNGLIAFSKPRGMRSTELVNMVKYVLQNSSWAGGRGGDSRKRSKDMIKIGHGGTLDPLASGVLVIGIGRGTKLLHDQLGGTVKGYRAQALFGKETDTYDSDGKTIGEAPTDHITRELIESKLENFRGKVEQIPPLYSALQMDGKRLYDYAREGLPLPREVEKRSVEAYRIEVASFDRTDQGLKLEMDLEVSSGYYVRSLIHDLGIECGSMAHMIALERTRQGDFGTFGAKNPVMGFDLVQKMYNELKAGVSEGENELEKVFLQHFQPIRDQDQDQKSKEKGTSRDHNHPNSFKKRSRPSQGPAQPVFQKRRKSGGQPYE